LLKSLAHLQKKNIDVEKVLLTGCQQVCDKRDTGYLVEHQDYKRDSPEQFQL
jgi:hypothetical protein